MDGLIDFMASNNGRIARIAAGAILVIVGVILITGDSAAIGVIVAVIGLVPIAAGVFDFCLFAPLFSRPFQGPELRGETGASETEE